MKINKTNIFILIVGLIIITCFTTCKKYKENNLWFKNPEKAFKGGFLNCYTVDGVDSIPMWNNIYNTPPDYNGWGYPFDIRKAYFAYDYKNDRTGFNSNIGNGVLKFTNKKKELEIGFKMFDAPGFVTKYNIFLTKNSTWKILKLTKGGSLKIQRIYNNKTYEIQIN